MGEELVKKSNHEKVLTRKSLIEEVLFRHSLVFRFGSERTLNH